MRCQCIVTDEVERRQSRDKEDEAEEEASLFASVEAERLGVAAEAPNGDLENVIVVGCTNVASIRLPT